VFGDGTLLPDCQLVHFDAVDGDGVAVELAGDGYVVASVGDDLRLIGDFVDLSIRGNEDGGGTPFDALLCAGGVILHGGLAGAGRVFDETFEIRSHTECGKTQGERSNCCKSFHVFLLWTPWRRLAHYIASIAGRAGFNGLWAWVGWGRTGFEPDWNPIGTGLEPEFRLCFKPRVSVFNNFLGSFEKIHFFSPRWPPDSPNCHGMSVRRD
jgi:hypothetical protein